MRIHVYVSEMIPDLLGFTLDETGANLPLNLGPWLREDLPGIMVIAETDDEISEVVQRDGFCLVDERTID